MSSPDRRKRIALFPGAFRPPHAVHFEAVRQLARRADIDEVRVIISNRCREIADTGFGLDASLASAVWTIYLDGYSKVSLEIAPHTAIGHTRRRVERGHPDEELLLCIGEDDWRGGDDRFSWLEHQRLAAGTRASLEILPTRGEAIRSTNLRRALASGDRAFFLEALPRHLTASMRLDVWSLCEAGRRPLAAIVRDKLKAWLDGQGLNCLKLTTDESRMPIYALRAALVDSRQVTILHAGDSPNRPYPSNRGTLKPRRRLACEARALATLADAPIDDFRVPETIVFDRDTTTLAIAENTSGPTLAAEISTGRVDGAAWRRVLRAIARLHAVRPHEPIRETRSADRSHWERWLSEYLEVVSGHLVEPRRLKNLAQESRQASRSGFFHLKLGPQQVTVPENGPVAVSNFEVASSWGDPAFDLGTLVGHCVSCTAESAGGMRLARTLLRELGSYGGACSGQQNQLIDRALRFAAVTLVGAPSRELAELGQKLLERRGPDRADVGQRSRVFL